MPIRSAGVDYTDALCAKVTGIVCVRPPACRAGPKGRPAKAGPSGRQRSGAWPSRGRRRRSGGPGRASSRPLAPAPRSAPDPPSARALPVSTPRRKSRAARRRRRGSGDRLAEPSADFPLAGGVVAIWHGRHSKSLRGPGRGDIVARSDARETPGILARRQASSAHHRVERSQVARRRLHLARISGSG
jgi:hypothetical protein